MKRLLLVSSVAGLLMMACGGCAYFRWGDPSYGELEQKAKEKKDTDSKWFKPGTTFYTR